MVLVGAPGQLVGVALGRVGALNPPDGEVGSDEVAEALEPVQQRPLLARREEWVGDGLGPVERRRLPARSDQEVAPRVAQREGAQGRTSKSSPLPTTSRSVVSSPRRGRRG